MVHENARPDRMASHRALDAALRRTPPDRAEVVAALALVPSLRRDLDRVERTAIDAARRCGASWAEIASALGLASRQAAEQRRLRLAREPDSDTVRARHRRRRQRVVDDAAGTPVLMLRAAVADLVAAIDRTADWEGRGGVAGLARRTLDIAVAADPGALVDLARLAVDDLTRFAADDPTPLAVSDPPMADALDRVRAILKSPPLKKD